MGANIPLPALHLNPVPQPPDVLEQLGKLQALKYGQGQQQLQQGQIQQQQQQMKDQQAMTKAMQDSSIDWADPNSVAKLPSIVLKNGGSSQAVFGIQQHFLEQRAKFSAQAKDDAETGQKNLQTTIDDGKFVGSKLQSILQLPDEQLHDGALKMIAEMAQPRVAGQQPLLAPDKAQPMAQQIAAMQDPKALRQQIQIIANTSMGMTAVAEQANKEASTKKDLAQASEATARAGELGPLRPDQIDQANQGMALRWQVLHPNAPPPAAFTLQPNATKEDFARVDKLLSGTEQAAGTQAQRVEGNALRAQTAQMAKDSQNDRLAQHGIQPVVGTDANGRQVLVAESEAAKLGLTGIMKADADLVNKSHAASTWLKLADKPGSTSDTMGIVQLIDKLDKDGKLGTIASRWNEFMAGKVGAGDPDFAAFRAKMGLGATKLMQAHVGSRGGAFMLEHFEDLANAGKMDASTLKSAIASEIDYMKDVAMEPTKSTPTGPAKPWEKYPVHQ